MAKQFFKSKFTKQDDESVQDDFEFCLSGINMIDLDKKYNMDLLSSIETLESSLIRTEKRRTHSDFNQTKIDQLRSQFFDKPIPTMLNLSLYKLINTPADIFLKNTLLEPWCFHAETPCFFCRRCFDNETILPLSMPIKELKICKQTKKQSTHIIPDNSNNLYFVGNGKYCSFNCLVADLQSFSPSASSLIYNNIIKLYDAIFGFKPSRKILKAPSWKLLISNGGFLSNQEYENCLQKITFVDLHQFKRINTLTDNSDQSNLSNHSNQSNQAKQTNQSNQTKQTKITKPVDSIIKFEPQHSDKSILSSTKLKSKQVNPDKILVKPSSKQTKSKTKSI